MKKIALFLVLAAPAVSFAAVPVEVSTALTDGLADASTVAGLALVIVVAIAVFKYMRRAI